MPHVIAGALTRGIRSGATDGGSSCRSISRTFPPQRWIPPRRRLDAGNGHVRGASALIDADASRRARPCSSKIVQRTQARVEKNCRSEETLQPFADVGCPIAVHTRFTPFFSSHREARHDWCRRPFGAHPGAAIHRRGPGAPARSARVARSPARIGPHRHRRRGDARRVAP